MDAIEPEFMVFLAEGQEAVGAVRSVGATQFMLYVETAGEFAIPRAAVRAVHDGKVIIDPGASDPAVRRAMRHQHDAEDRTAG